MLPFRRAINQNTVLVFNGSRPTYRGMLMKCPGPDRSGRAYERSEVIITLGGSVSGGWVGRTSLEETGGAVTFRRLSVSIT